MDDFVLNVRQIGNYSQLDHIGAYDLVLVQQGGIGGPYACVTQDGLLGQVFERMNVGILPIPNNKGILSNFVMTPLGQRQGFNWYVDQQGISRYMQNGPAGAWNMVNTAGDLQFATAPPGVKDAAIDQTTWNTIFDLTLDGQLTVGGIDLTAPGGGGGMSGSVATMPWVLANTVNTFNGRLGVVTLTLADVNAALGVTAGDAVATHTWVNNAISTALTNFYNTQPLVQTFNGRTGSVALTLADITGAGGAPLASPAFQGAPTAPTPPASDNSTRIATTAFVVAQAAADLTGYAPLASPAFTGVPTAPTAVAGTTTSQLATTSFVMNAVNAVVSGVSSWNTRTGAVTLTLADCTAVGVWNNAALTGNCTAVTQPQTDQTTKLATTQFVATAISNAVIAAGGGVTTFNGRAGAVTLLASDVTGAGGAPISSPAFTGTPTAPSPPAADNSGALATTAWVDANAVNSFNGRAGAVTFQANDISAVGGALLNGPAFTGVPTAPTAVAGTNTTQIATTQFVTAALSVAAGVSSFNTRTGAITLNSTDITGAGGALLASPALTGSPTAPTATPGTSSTVIATTAFVSTAIGNAVTSFNSRTGAITLNTTDITNAGGAPIASPTFTGIPAGPTAAPGTSSTQLATTSFVSTSFAPLASPALTGTPTVPTAGPGTNTTQAASTAFVTAAISATAGGFQIGDILNTVRGLPTSPGTWLACDGSIQTTATYTTLQGYLGNNFAVFASATNPTTINAYTSLWDASVSLFVAAGYNAGTTGTGIATAPAPGTTWTARGSSVGGTYWVSLAQNGTTLMVVDNLAASCQTSTTGTTWTTAAAPTLASGETFAGLAAGGTSNLFVAVGNGVSGTTAGTIKTSPAGTIAWTARTTAIPIAGTVQGVAASPSVIIVWDNQNNWATSPTGATWTLHTSYPFNATYAKISYVNNLFIVTDSSENYWTSPGTDGVNWTQFRIPGYDLGGTLSLGTGMQLVGYCAPLYMFQDQNQVTLLTPDLKQWHTQPPVAIMPGGRGSTQSNIPIGNAGVLVSGAGSGILVSAFTNSATQFTLPNINNNLYGSQPIPAYIRAL